MPATPDPLTMGAMNLRDLAHRATITAATCVAAGTLIAGQVAHATVPVQEAAASLFAVAATSATDAWAVGSRFGGQTDRTLTERWNGSRWSHVPSPTSGCGDGDELQSVSAISPGNVWAVGVVTNCLSGARTADAFHWNGKWTEIAPPNPGGFLGSELFGVDAVSASNVWAVGDYPSGQTEGYLTLIVHWNGSQWRQVASPSPTGSSKVHTLDAVAARTASDIWATGFSIRKFPDAETTVALHWNGTSWRRQL
jgi:hypothetical protein